MECEKCQDWGFTEEEHGLIMVFCDCAKGEELRAEVTGQPLPPKPICAVIEAGEHVVPLEALDDSNSGTGPDNSNIGSPDTGKSKQPKKSRAKKKTRKRTS